MTKSIFRVIAGGVAFTPSRFNGGVRPAACFREVRRLGAQRVAAFALVAAVLTVAADPAFAQFGGGEGDITMFLQNLVNLITGTAGKLVSVLSICTVGVGALMGAMSMRAAGGVTMGVLLIFSSAWIVNQIIGQ